MIKGPALLADPPPVRTRPRFLRPSGLLAIVLLAADPLGAQTELTRIDGLDEFDELGFSVSVVGDVNGDGVADLIAGADEASPGGRLDAGEALVYSGADRSILYRIEGEIPMDFFGWTVSGAGDVNDDSVPDFVVGAPFASPGGRSWAGIAYVFSGADGCCLHRIEGTNDFDRLGYTVSELFRVNGEEMEDRLGISVCSAGDVNGDGLDDVAGGAYLADPGGLLNAG